MQKLDDIDPHGLPFPVQQEAFTMGDGSICSPIQNTPSGVDPADYGGWIRLGTWEQGLPACYLDVTGEWRRLETLTIRSSCWGQAIEHASFAPIADTIPQEWLARAHYFNGPCRFLVLRLLATGTEAQDLNHSNPALFWLIADAIRSGDSTFDAWRDRMGEKQSILLNDIMEDRPTLGARWLRRVRLQPGLAAESRDLRAVLINPRFAPLRHWPFISMSSLRVLLQRPGLMHAPTVKRWIQSEPERINSALGVVDLTSAFPGFSWEHVEVMLGELDIARLRDNMTAFYRICQNAAYDTSPYADLTFAHWLPGSADIRPLCTVEELREEGERMQHCVLSYTRRTAGGHLAIYHVSGDPGATLAISTITDTGTHLEVDIELAGPRNESPSPEEILRVGHWLGSHGVQGRWPASCQRFEE